MNYKRFYRMNLAATIPALLLLAGCGAGEGTNGRGFNAIPVAPVDLEAKWYNPASPVIEISWADHSTNVDSYVLERRKDGEENFTVIADDIPADTQTFTDVQVDKTVAGYSYRVLGRNSAGDSVPPPEVFVSSPLPVCMSPFLTLQTTPGPTNIGLKWTDFCDNEKGFDITLEVKTTQTFVAKHHVWNPVSIDTFDGLASLTDYSIFFTAFNDFGETEIRLGFSEMTLDSAGTVP